MPARRPKHPDAISPSRYRGMGKVAMMKLLAEDIGSLRYDALYRFLNDLCNKIRSDSVDDAARGRQRLAARLVDVAVNIDDAATYTLGAWEICARYMRGEDENKNEAGTVGR